MCHSRLAEEMLRHDAGRNTPLWKLAVEYEMARGNLTAAEVLAKMVQIVRIVRRSIRQGIAGTYYDDRILGHQSGAFKARMDAGQLLAAGVLNRAVLYVTALMEVKSSMGVIVAAPTAGAVPRCRDRAWRSRKRWAVGRDDGESPAGQRPDRRVHRHPLDVCGGSGRLPGGGWLRREHGRCRTRDVGRRPAGSSGGGGFMAFQSMIGLICDPVANRVEVPCLGKNVLAASNAISWQHGAGRL